MKIQGTHLAKITTAYKNHLKEQKKQNMTEKSSDELKISNEAKKLQQNEKMITKRSEYISEIKQAVDSGKYEINHKVTAQKMIDFWSKRP